jgi:hypothetical protein
MTRQLLASSNSDWLGPLINDALDSLGRPLLATIVFIVVAQLFIGHILPRTWMHFEWLWLRLSLGRSQASRWVMGYAMKDFELSVRQREIDYGAPRTLAVLFAIGTRVKELALGMTGELKTMRDAFTPGMFESAINSLNHGWQTGAPPKILRTYMAMIEASQDDREIPKVDRLRGMCSVALVKYALGDIRRGLLMGKRNWDAVKTLEPELQPETRWLASYAYFNSTLFFGEFGKAMNLMAGQWNEHYARSSPSQKQEMIKGLRARITLNPILTIPRHIILAAAFNDEPNFDAMYWPGGTVPADLSTDKIEKEMTWVKSWYDEARDICADELISLNFSRAYMGFYLTLLLPEATPRQEGVLRERITQAFSSIDDSSPVVSRYVKYGFRGVYHLVSGGDEEALRDLRIADNSSEISGNRFAECIFMCCHAVAAARLARKKADEYLEPEINHYLKQARKLSKKIGGSFYPALWSGAFATVCQLRGQTGKVERYEHRSEQVQKGGKRILRIFKEVKEKGGDTNRR